MSASEESLALLRSIDAGIKTLIALSQRRTQAIASAAEMDGSRGDPIIKAKDPRDWKGQSMVGHNLSECPADYLELLALRSDYFAEKETDAKKAGWAKRDAALARGWAKRAREYAATGGKLPAQPDAVTATEWEADQWVSE